MTKKIDEEYRELRRKLERTPEYKKQRNKKLMLAKITKKIGSLKFKHNTLGYLELEFLLGRALELVRENNAKDTEIVSQE